MTLDSFRLSLVFHNYLDFVNRFVASATAALISASGRFLILVSQAPRAMPLPICNDPYSQHYVVGECLREKADSRLDSNEVRRRHVGENCLRYMIDRRSCHGRQDGTGEIEEGPLWPSAG